VRFLSETEDEARSIVSKPRAHSSRRTACSCATIGYVARIVGCARSRPSLSRVSQFAMQANIAAVRARSAYGSRTGCHGTLKRGQSSSIKPIASSTRRTGFRHKPCATAPATSSCARVWILRRRSSCSCRPMGRRCYHWPSRIHQRSVDAKVVKTYFPSGQGGSVVKPVGKDRAGVRQRQSKR
jgi:hypothetical protein